MDKTLRDEFAIAAMTGDLASALGHFDMDGDTEDFRTRARLYYRIADAMMQERKPKVKPFRRKEDLE